MDIFNILVVTALILIGIKLFDEKCPYSWTVALSPLIGPIIFGVLVYAISSAIKCCAISLQLFL